MKNLISISIFAIFTLILNNSYSQNKINNDPAIPKKEALKEVNEIINSESGGNYTTVFQSNTSALRTAGTVGTLPGNQSVSSSGSGTYDIPIWVSPGTNGMQPELNISYNSSRSNGMMGLGWAIGGLSAITRVPKDFQHFGISNSGVNLNTNDVFMLDGNLLFVTNGGVYGANGTEYHTESETFSKIISKSLGGQVTAYFEVYTKDGRILQYGYSADSRVEVPTNSANTAIYWQLNKVTDANGNYMTYHYLEAGGECLVSSIDYTGTTSFLPYLHVEFTYINNRYDANTVYVAGIAIPSTQVLDKIKLKDDNGGIIRKYDFSYNQDFNNIRLTEIKYFGDGGGSSLNSTLITWGTPTIDFNQILQNHNPGIALNSYTGDFNGDGITDLITTDPDNDDLPSDNFGCRFFNRQALLIFPTTCFTTFNHYNFYPQGSLVADVDGDGMDEFVAIFRDNSGQSFDVRIFKYSTNAFVELTAAAITLNNCQNYTLSKGDFDGNGTTDLLVKTTINAINCGPFDYWYYYTYNVNTGLSDLVSSGNFWTTGLLNTKFYSIEFNGDGKTDILMTYDDFSSTYCKIIDFTPNGITTLYSSGFPSPWHAIYPGDFNGDGKTDLLTWENVSHTMHVSYSDGVIFTPEQHFSSVPMVIANNPISDPITDNFYVADFNGDGKDDVTFIATTAQPGAGVTSHVAVYYSRGNNVFNLEYHTGYTDCVYDPGISIGDFNGDGKQDLFNQHYTYVGNGNWFYNGWDVVTFHADEQQNLVQTIENGFDVTSHFYYQPLTELAGLNNIMGHYLKGNGAQFPVFDYQGPMYVVSRTNKTDPSGNMLNDMEYKYWGAKIHRQGGGFLTFAKTDAIERATFFHHIIYSSYDINYFYPIIEQTSQEHHLGPIIDNHFITTFTNDKLNLGNSTFFPYISKTIHVDYLKNITSTQDNTYDNYGNQLTDHIYTANGFDVMITNTYGKYPTNIHCDNKLTNNISTTTYPGQTSYTVEKTFSYNTTTGNLIDLKTSPGSINSWVNMHYDIGSYGTVAGTILTGSQNYNPGWPTPVDYPAPQSYSFSYNPKHRFIIDTKNPLGQSAFYDYEYNTGNVINIKDIDKIDEGFRYDPFGREAGHTPKRSKLNPSLGEISTTYYWATGTTSEPQYCSYYIETVPSNTANFNRPKIVKYYDAFERLLRTETEKLKNSTTPQSIFIDNVYEPNTGRLLIQYKPFWASSPTTDRIEFIYSAIDGRIERSKEFNSVAPNALITDYTYNNSINQVTVDLPSGQQEIKTYDDFGNLMVSYVNGETQDYSYYSNGKISFIKGPISTVEMTYDDFGNQVTLKDPDAGLMEYKYNAFGQLIEQADAKGDKFEFEYNVMGMMTRKTETCTSCGGQISTYNYSYVLNGNAVNKIEKMELFGTPLEESYSYTTGMPDLASKTVVDDLGNTFVTNFAYTLDGLLDKTTYPNAIEIKNTYNKGFLTTISDVSGLPYWTMGTENQYGQPVNYTYGSNGLQANFTYDDWHYPTDISMSNGSWQQSYDFDYVTGNLSRRFDPIKATQPFETFNYYQDRQLQSSSSPSSPVFNINYGNEGNFESKDDVGAYAYNGPTAHSPDKLTDNTPSGNCPIPHPIQDIRYTAFNKVSEINENGSHLKISYTPQNKRIRTDLTDPAGQLKSKFFIGDFERTDYSQSGGLKTDIIYLHSPYGLIGAVEKIGIANPTTYFIRTDYLGSISAIYDGATSALLEEYSYDAWGRRRDPSNWSYYPIYSAPPLKFERGYTGHEELPEFDLINMNGRMYDPSLCKMLSADNINNDPESSLGLNRYAYVGNNPLKYSDPTGQKWWHWAIADVITGGAVSSIGAAAFGTASITGAVAFAGATGAVAAGVGTQIAISTDPILSATLSGISGYFSTGNGHDRWNAARMRTNNSWGISLGLPLHIPVWESGQAILGASWSQFRNITGEVDNVEYHNGTILVNDRTDDPTDQWGATLGQYINSRNVDRNGPNNGMYKHEYGHTIQSRILGPLYLSKIAVPSLISQVIGNDYHDNSWMEVWASQLGGAGQGDYNYEHSKKNWWYWPAVIFLPFFPY